MRQTRSAQSASLGQCIQQFARPCWIPFHFRGVPFHILCATHNFRWSIGRRRSSTSYANTCDCIQNSNGWCRWPRRKSFHRKDSRKIDWNRVHFVLKITAKIARATFFSRRMHAQTRFHRAQPQHSLDFSALPLIVERNERRKEYKKKNGRRLIVIAFRTEKYI